MPSQEIKNSEPVRYMIPRTKHNKSTFRKGLVDLYVFNLRDKENMQPFFVELFEKALRKLEEGVLDPMEIQMWVYNTQKQWLKI